MHGKDKIRVLIAEDHRIISEGLALLIEHYGGMKVVGLAGDGAEAVELFRQLRPDVVLMDLRMPKMSGVEAIAAIRQEFPKARIVVLTSYDGNEHIYRALQAGAQGYLLKDASRDQLLVAIRTVHMGQTTIPEPIAARLAERMNSANLTARELEVLHFMKEGKMNQEIAQALFITEGTVKSHVNRILEKMKVSGRTQAVTTALQRGLL